MNIEMIDKYKKIISERIMPIQVLAYEQLFPKENRVKEYPSYLSKSPAYWRCSTIHS